MFILGKVKGKKNYTEGKMKEGKMNDAREGKMNDAREGKRSYGAVNACRMGAMYGGWIWLRADSV